MTNDPLTPEELAAIRERVADRSRRLHQSPEYLDTTAEGDRRALWALPADVALAVLEDSP